MQDKKKNLSYSLPSFTSPFGHLFVLSHSTPHSLIFLFYSPLSFLHLICLSVYLSRYLHNCLLQDLPKFTAYSTTGLSIYWCQNLCIQALSNIMPEPIKRPNWMTGWKRMLSSSSVSIPGLSLTYDAQRDPYSFLSRISMMATTIGIVLV